MCNHNQCFRAKKKYIIIFHLKLTNFTAVKNCSILHGRVFVMVNLFISHPFLGSPSWMTGACSSVSCCVDTFGQRRMEGHYCPLNETYSHVS